MKRLFFRSRKNTANYKKNLAVFFLSVLFISCSYSLKNTKNLDSSLLYLLDRRLYSFSPLSPEKENSLITDKLTLKQRAFTSYDSKTILVWDEKSKNLLKINSEGRVKASIKLPASSVRINKDFVLTQSMPFESGKGFSFSLYKISSSAFLKRIKLDMLWSGYLDCFISDAVFTDEGIIIAGGNREDSLNKLYYISEKGVDKLFELSKKGDFLRLLYKDKALYTFVSGKDKSYARPLVYKINIASKTSELLDLSTLEAFPLAFDCFFGFGFIFNNNLILPSSINNQINFIALDFERKKIVQISPESRGCLIPLGEIDGLFYYVARDSLNKNSFYGIASYDGIECKEILDFLNL